MRTRCVKTPHISISSNCPQVAMTTRDVRFHHRGLTIEQLSSLDGSKFMTKSELRSCSRVAGPRRKREAHAVDHWSLGTNEGIGIWRAWYGPRDGQSSFAQFTVLPRQWRLGSLGRVVGTEREVRWKMPFEIPT